MLREYVPKTKGLGAREVPSAVTFDKVRPHLLRVGVTRIANITWLDRIGIPVFTAISPRSNDFVSVYAGKGLGEIDAKTSAVMEAIERFSAAIPRRPDEIASFTELLRAGRRVIDPRSLNLEVTHQYRDDLPIFWCRALDLLNEETVLIPQDAAVYNPKYYDSPCYEIATTNGLASGNSLEEAICHALAEVIERDAITLAELVSNRLGNVLRAGLGLNTLPDHSSIEDLKALHPHLDMFTLPSRISQLVARFESANVGIRVLDISSDVGIPSFLANAAEDLGSAMSRSHWGLGTAPNAEVALIRAITECAQGRAADIQAMREDISMPGQDVGKHLFHARRIASFNKESWAW